MCSSDLLFSPLIAAFYNTPILAEITKYYACYFLISAFYGVPIILLEKKLSFKKLFFLQFSALFISLIFSVFFAIYGYGIWSILVQPLLQAILLNVFVWITAEWYPIFVWKKQEFLSLQKKALPILGGNLLAYSTRNIDNLLIGKYFDEATLGNYARAYSLMQMPFQLINGIIIRVMLPSFALIQEDISRLRNLYLRMIALLALCVFPISVGMMLVSDKLILLLFGEKWEGVVPILQILSLVGAIQSVISPVGLIYFTCQKNKLFLKNNLITSGIAIICMGIGIFISVKMVAFMIGFSSLISLVIHISAIGKLIDFSVSAWIKNLIPTILCTILMGICVFLVGKIAFSQVFIFALKVFTGIVSYVICLHIGRVAAYKELKEMLISRIYLKARKE